MNYVFYLALITLLVYWVESPVMAFPNFLIIRKNPADELEIWLKNFGTNRQELKSQSALPVYKFYSEVIEVLLNLARRMGGNYQEALLFLREGLQNDRQFEKKVKSAVLGTWLQMGLMMGLTWLFIMSAVTLVGMQVDGWKLFLIFFWQLIGLSILPLCLRWLRKKYFGDIGKIWKMLFVLKSLMKVPLSRTEVLTLAGVGELNHVKQNSLLSIVSKLKETCQKTLKMGTSYEDDVRYLMDELRFQEKWHFELFEKRITALKLAILSLFFLPSYLGFIFLLLGDLMSLM